jgi:lipopolysaccharide/colanic/teichoic acid biosynthesis glycosyltransferase
VLVVIKPTLKPASADVVTRLVAHLEEHPYAAAAAPTVRGQTGEILPTAHPAPERRTFSRVECLLGEALAIRRADAVAAATARRRRLRATEDVNLCLALRRRGREIHYLTGAECLDASGAVSARLSEPRADVSRQAGRLWRRNRQPGRVARLLARAVDAVVAGLLIVLLAPLFLVISLAVRLESPGPALFRQRRVGRDATHFEMFKFRTMHDKSDPGLHEHFVRDMIVNRVRGKHQGEAQVFKIHPDPRITRVGRLLRRTSLDELPQLFNILRGEMSFVGFRPPIPYELSSYPDWYFRRFDSKPGITGLWQVSGRNQCSYEEMICLDIEYVNRRSWRFDLVLLVRTVGVVISGRGAY